MTENSADMHATCPYRKLPDESYWRKSVALPQPSEVNPALRGGFALQATDRIATAGSCFAQNIARFLKKSGYNYFVTEDQPSVIEKVDPAFNYGTFSARYGNIYTARQLRQLLDRAYGEFLPDDDFWEHGGRFYDPFRPQIQPSGFASLSELRADRSYHFKALRQMVEEMDVFVFTLGLTEAWVSSRDGAVYPVCPGCGAGTHDPDVHQFQNFSASDTSEDLLSAFQHIRERNADCRFIVTVSPVPLIATATQNHVLTATSYSKAALRVAAEEVVNSLHDCDYFPSYEIITGGFNRGSYFAQDLRSVTDEGVGHVMRCFSEVYMDDQPSSDAGPRLDRPQAAQDNKSEVVNDIICEEEMLVR